MNPEDPTLRIPAEDDREDDSPTLASDLETTPTVVTTGASGGTGGLGLGTGSDLPHGSLISNRYRIRDVLGVGGMGIVYRVDDEVLSIPLALKILRPEIAQDGDFLQRFRNELVLARQVTHRNVVRIHDIGEHHGMYYMTMDWVDGRSLQSLIRDEGKLDLEKALNIVAQVAAALDEAHRKGVVHRDLKPANILLDTDGQAFVTDFGVARSLASSGLTRTGEVLGTPDYLSPEQARGEKVDGRSDLYTLGLIFVEMLSGKLPFPGGTVFEVLAQRMSGNMRSLDELGVEVPEAYDEVIDQWVAKDPQDRFQTAQDLIAALDATGQPGHRSRSQTRRRLRTRNALIIAAAMALVTLASYRLFAPDSPSDDDGVTVGEASAEVGQTTPDLPAVPPSGDIRHHLAVLPFAVDDDSQWAALALARGLDQSLAASSELRVIEGPRIFQALDNLELGGTRLRDDQVRRLFALLEIDHLVLGSLESSAAGWRADAQLIAVEDHQLSRRPVAAIQRDVESLPVLHAELKAALFEALGTDAPQDAGLPLPSGVEAQRSFGDGLRQLAAGQLDGAVDALLATTREAPDFVPAWLQLIEVYRQAGRPNEAHDAAKEAVRLSEESSRYGLDARAQEALLRGRPEDAVGFLQRLTETYPNLIQARLRQAETYGQMGQLDHALAHLDRAVQLDAANPRAWYLRGRYAIGLGQLRRAVDDDLVRALGLFKNLKEETGQALVLNALGVGHQRLGEVEQATEHYEQAATIRRRIDDRPGLASTLHNLAWIYLSRGDLQAAEDKIRQALAIQEELENPQGMAEMHNAYGMLEESRGRFSEALQQFQKALRIRDDLGIESALAESHNNVGFAYFVLGEYANARLYLEKALALHRQNDEPRGIIQVQQNVGFCQIAQGEWDAAIVTFEEALALSGGVGEKTAIAVSQGNLARIALAQGRFDDARALYDEALDILRELGSPTGQAEFTLDLASMFIELEDLEAAQAALDTLAQWLEDDGSHEHRSRFHALRGFLALRRQDPDRAKEEFDLAAQRAEDSDSPAAVLEARLGQGLVNGDLAVLEAAWQDAESLGHMLLRLRLTEALAELQIRRGQDDIAEGRLRDALRLAEDRSYRRTYRLFELLAEVQDALGKGDAAERSRRQAEEHRQRMNA